MLCHAGLVMFDLHLHRMLSTASWLSDSRVHSEHRSVEKPTGLESQEHVSGLAKQCGDAGQHTQQCLPEP